MKRNNTSEYLNKVQNYIIEVIDASGYDLDPQTEKDKLQFLASVIQDQYLFKYNFIRFGSVENVTTEWIKGCPSCFNVEYYPHKIIEIETSFGNPPSNEASEEYMIESWFSFLSKMLMQLFRKYGIKLTVQP